MNLTHAQLQNAPEYFQDRDACIAMCSTLEGSPNPSFAGTTGLIFFSFFLKNEKPTIIHFLNERPIACEYNVGQRME